MESLLWKSLYLPHVEQSIFKGFSLKLLNLDSGAAHLHGGSEALFQAGEHPINKYLAVD